MIKGFNFKLLALGIVVLVIIFLPSFSRFQNLRQEDKELAELIREEKTDRVRLEEEKKRLEEDEFYIEKVAREKMGVVKKGEIIYKIVPEDN
ncbi:MAG: septum formation initiator family protein [Candidatus Gygaella obscura]|nr:septum formation initiator family protein [Candidatus Gygaella obscura]